MRKILAAAKTCTGEYGPIGPDNWEWIGKKHLSGTCYCPYKGLILYEKPENITGKLSLMLAELQDLEKNFPKSSSIFRFMQHAIFNIDGAMCAINSLKEK